MAVIVIHLPWADSNATRASVETLVIDNRCALQHLQSSHSSLSYFSEKGEILGVRCPAPTAILPVANRMLQPALTGLSPPQSDV